MASLVHHNNICVTKETPMMLLYLFLLCTTTLAQASLNIWNKEHKDWSDDCKTMCEHFKDCDIGCTKSECANKLQSIIDAEYGPIYRFLFKTFHNVVPVGFDTEF